MNEKLNKNARLEQLAKMILSREEEKGLIVKGPLIKTSLIVIYFLNHSISTFTIYPYLYKDKLPIPVW